MDRQPRTDDGLTELRRDETVNTASAPIMPSSPVQLPEEPVVDTFPGNQAAPLEARPDTQYVPDEEPAISWTASEFITHEKSTDWYLGLGVVDVIIAILAYLILRDWVATVVIIIAGLGFAVYGGWKPRQQQYGLSGQGLSIGQRFYGFEEFRSFSLVDEGAFTSIQFSPLKRFGTPVNIYYDPTNEEAILQLIGTHLPLEEAKNDPVDKLIRRIRF